MNGNQVPKSVEITQEAIDTGAEVRQLQPQQQQQKHKRGSAVKATTGAAEAMAVSATVQLADVTSADAAAGLHADLSMFSGTCSTFPESCAK
jgi:hypothetical protein